MALRQLPLTLGVFIGIVLLLAAALDIWAPQADALFGTGTRLAGFAPWITAAIAVAGAAFAVALARRPAVARAGGAALASDLRESEARLEAIVGSAMDAIITINATHRIVLFNAAAEKMFGCGAAEAIGAPLDRFIPERFRGTHRAHLEHFSRTGDTSRRMGMQTALWALHADGTEFPIEASISQAIGGGQKLLTVILRDITERLSSEREIRRAHQELREGESRLEAIVRSAMDAIITVDADQRIVLFNATAEKMLGCSAADAIGGPLDRFIPKRFHATHREHVERFGRTGETARRMGMQTALWALHADGTEFPIEASISQAIVGGQKLFTVILRDITERLSSEREIRRSHQEVREGESRLEAIVGSAMDGIITVAHDGRIVVFNAAAERMFKCSAAQAIGTRLDRFIPERFRMAHAAHIDRFSRTGETSRRMGLQTALWALRTDGVEFPIEASISQAHLGDQQLLTVILRDITERTRAEQDLRHAHEELRELALAMHEVREGERTRIARELHDELGQALTALKMDVDLLGSTIPQERGDLLERTDAMRGLLDSTVATTRRISADLRPLVLDDLGLGAAAEWLAQGFSQRTRIPCDLSVDAACSQLGEPHASALFRIMQESLTNVARHAHASRVEVSLERSGDDAVLTVRDDGVGMDPSARPKPRSFGLRGIGERALLLGGELRIDSRPGAGTTVVARIPVNRARRAAAAA